MDRCTGPGMGKGHELPCSLQGSGCPQISHVHQLGSSPNLILLDFSKGFITKHNRLNHWPSVIGFSPQPSLLPAEQGVGLIIPALSSPSRFPRATSPQPLVTQGLSRSHRVNIVKDTSGAANTQKITRILGHLCQEMYRFLIINHNVTHM